MSRQRDETACYACGTSGQVGVGKNNCASCGHPVPSRPSPFICTDPFWGDTPSWVATPLIIGFALALLFVSFVIGCVIAGSL